MSRHDNGITLLLNINKYKEMTVQTRKQIKMVLSCQPGFIFPSGFMPDSRVIARVIGN